MKPSEVQALARADIGWRIAESRESATETAIGRDRSSVLGPRRVAAKLVQVPETDPELGLGKGQPTFTCEANRPGLYRRTFFFLLVRLVLPCVIRTTLDIISINNHYQGNEVKRICLRARRDRNPSSSPPPPLPPPSCLRCSRRRPSRPPPPPSILSVVASPQRPSWRTVVRRSLVCVASRSSIQHPEKRWDEERRREERQRGQRGRRRRHHPAAGDEIAFFMADEFSMVCYALSQDTPVDRYLLCTARTPAGMYSQCASRRESTPAPMKISERL
ncbi:hypothetical protein KC354_g146 [Hortaea werneckii]|nr:hypothetical protein KC354_g146 [Hortaea werneckii]